MKKSVFNRNKADPIELISSFGIRMRNKMAHGTVLDEKGRWSDLALTRIDLFFLTV